MLGTANGRAAFPPEVEREFRGAWIASVGNINWPSKPGLSVVEQKRELTAILDRAGKLNLSAVILQVRPATEVLYESATEPWSEYLTGTMGRAPEPRYDPLAFAVTEAHQRGLELHAWFNPYRVRHSSAKSPVPSSHISRQHPDWVRTYGRQLWLDPGEPKVRDYTLAAVFDIVQRYDIDGIHYDDYFYPYPEKDAKGASIDFPDDATWKKYQASGGKLSRDDWRRDNVNQFVERLYTGVKERKRWVKVGISPFGIWRPGHPPQIKGLDAYAVLYGDAKLWLEKGWCDYFTPQLYWAIDPPAQSYPVLLKWWAEQNPLKRHLWAGNNLNKASTGAWKPDEILNQIKLTRAQPGATGNIFFDWKALAGTSPLADAMMKQPYARQSLPPPSPWLDNRSPGKPTVETRHGSASEAVWTSTGGEPAWLWVVQWNNGSSWQTRILPSQQTSMPLSGDVAKAVSFAVTAVDRCGNTSMPSVIDIKR